MELRLCGDVKYCNLQLKNTDGSVKIETNKLSENPFSDNSWDNDTVIRANFTKDNPLSGSNFDGSYGGSLDHFKVYKTLSNQPRLYKVFETQGAVLNVIEDFMVGSKCPYTYYIYPVSKDGDIETLGTLMKSQPIELDDGVIRVFGLIQDPENPNKYTVDMYNVWHIQFNLSDEGFTNNMAKNYPDTLHQFQKKIQGNGNYRTFPISGLLGKFDCESHEYIDTYDDIVEWEEFMNNGQLKAVVDLRGVITLGDIDSNSFQYNPNGADMVSVSFTFRELESINNVDIFNRQLIANPLRYKVLADMYGKPLKTTEDDGENLFLLSDEEVV